MADPRGIGAPRVSTPFMRGFIALIQIGARSLTSTISHLNLTQWTDRSSLSECFWTVKSNYGNVPDVPATIKGERTKARIVRAAADLVARRGVAGTSIDDVCAVTRTSKSQLYHYFPDRAALLRDVVAVQADRVLDAQRPTLD